MRSALAEYLEAVSEVDEFLLVVDFVVQLVVVANARRSSERDIGLLVTGLTLFQLSVKLVPFTIKGLAIFLILCDCI